MNAWLLRTLSTRYSTLVLLALASGACGIAYEIIYIRILTTYFGHMYYVVAGVLAAFLLGVGAGALSAHRFRGWLPLVEALLGLYAFAAAGLFATGGLGALAAAIVPETTPPVFVLAIAVVLIAAPAFLAGVSVPAFGLRVRDARDTQDNACGFVPVYIVYNTGAAVCLLAIEFWAMRAIGITGTIVALGVLNLAVAICLALVGDAPAVRPTPVSRGQRASNTGAGARVALLAGIGSAVYQIAMYQTADQMFGPFGENVALILAVAIMGVSLGSVWAGRSPAPLNRWLVRTAAAMAATIAMVAPALWLWGHLAIWMSAFPVVLKAALIVLMTAPAFLFVGGIVVKILARTCTEDATAGRIMAASAVGNAMGFAAGALLIGAVPLWGAFAAAAFAILAAAAVSMPGDAARAPSRAAVLTASVLSVLLLSLAWPDRHLALGYTVQPFWDRKQDELRHISNIHTHARYTDRLNILEYGWGNWVFVLNGNRGLHMGLSGIEISEAVVGAAPAYFAAGTDKALVLGVGTGISTSAAMKVFDAVEAVDASPLLADTLPVFARGNMGLAEDPALNLTTQDASVVLQHRPGGYDAIINTVSAPMYYAASKLYTRGFMELAKSQLNDGGVYATWFDTRMGARSRDAFLRTLERTFAHCDYLTLRAGYGLALCGPGVADGMTGNPRPDLRLRRLMEQAGLRLSMHDVVEAIHFDDHPWEISENGPLNTYDRPVVEYYLKSLPARQWTTLAQTLAERVGRGNWDTCVASMAMGWKSCIDDIARQQCGRLTSDHVRDLMPLFRAGSVQDQAPRVMRHLSRTGRPELALDVGAAVLDADVPPPRDLRTEIAGERVVAATAAGLDQASRQRLYTAYIAENGVARPERGGVYQQYVRAGEITFRASDVYQAGDAQACD